MLTSLELHRSTVPGAETIAYIGIRIHSEQFHKQMILRAQLRIPAM